MDRQVVRRLDEPVLMDKDIGDVVALEAGGSRCRFNPLEDRPICPRRKIMCDDHRPSGPHKAHIRWFFLGGGFMGEARWRSM